MKPWERTYEQPDTAQNKPWEREYQPGPTIAAADQASEDRVKRLHDIAVGQYNSGVGYMDKTTPGAAVTLGGNSFLNWLGKPINAAMDVAVEKTRQALGTADVPDATAGEIWKASTGAYDDEYAAAKKQAGNAGTAAELAGSVVSPLNYVAPEARLIAPIAAGAIQGAAKGSNTLEGAGTGALTEGAINAVLPGALALTKPGASLLRSAADTASDYVGPASILGSIPTAAGLMWHGVDPLHAAYVAAAPYGISAGLKLGANVLERAPADNPVVNALARRAGLAASGQF